MARPDLPEAHPSGAVAGTFRSVGHAHVDVLMDDGTGGHCEVIGWARDISGNWRVKLLWYDVGVSQREDWYLYDPERVRLVRPGLGRRGNHPAPRRRSPPASWANTAERRPGQPCWGAALLLAIGPGGR
jgi:hypothetical protein